MYMYLYIDYCDILGALLRFMFVFVTGNQLLLCASNSSTWEKIKTIVIYHCQSIPGTVIMDLSRSQHVLFLIKTFASLIN